jgi:hypothetical protein
MDGSEFQKPVGHKKSFFALCWNVITFLVYLIFWFIVLSALLAFFTSGISCSGALLSAQRATVAQRGLDIHGAIVSANKDRETELLPPIWPKTCLADTYLPTDISGKVFKTSTEYFSALYDEDQLGTEKWKPWVSGFDYSKLAGIGVPAKEDKGKLQAKNNMWLIAANIAPEDSDLIPVLITRNVDVKEIERLVNCGGATLDLKVKIPIGQGVYKTPFGDKAFVIVRKGGETFSSTAKYARLDCIFRSETLPSRDPAKPPIVYLMP